MIHYPVRLRVFAACLSMLAGYIDATGFMHLGGVFVSFMSGNLTRLAVGMEQHPDMHAAIPAGIIGLFMIGVIAGSIIGRFAGRRRVMAVLGFVTFMLGIAAVFQDFHGEVMAIICITLAMGAENAIFERDGEVSIGLTYMTGTLVKMGQRISGAFFGGPRLAWLPYFMLWLSLGFGAYAGAVVYTLVGLDGLWIAVVWAAILMLISGKVTAPEN